MRNAFTFDTRKNDEEKSDFETETKQKYFL